MALDDLFDQLDRSRGDCLDRLFTLLRQPSVSAQNLGVRECAGLLAGMLEEAGMDAAIMETEGQPVVYAERIFSPEAYTVLFYGHYDVQPPEPLELWQSAPFSPEVRNGKIFGRGAADNKGQLLAHVLAVRTWLQTRGALPLNVKMVFEGEEESSSPHLDAFVARNRELLKSDLVYTSDGPLHETGAPLVVLGVRGILYIELTAVGAAWDNHSGNKGGIVPNPAWMLVDLLRTMRDRQGRVCIEGFAEGVDPPDAATVELIRRLPFDRQKIRAAVGYEGFDLDAETYYRKLMLEPTFNIAGFTSGYGGEGSKTIIPSKAVLKVDFRLVGGQDPEDIFRKVCRHVQMHAPQIQVTFLGAMRPSRTRPGLPAIDRVIAAVRQAYGVEPMVQPSLGGSLPDYVWTRTLGVPSVLVPYANADESNHAPNENLDLEKFYTGIKCSLCVLDRLSRGQAPAGQARPAGSA
ncbi:MAG: M20/M25/M40 family metallo-hydrolase [Desulfobacterales bacterium]|jgi:acetylornithine deacetylase/succinyl-diaminopimelate desuccinylase-like protein|nr:M20/M25/M40 family metallo-hydrolase [Desulfobacterales bacterium]